LVFGFNFHIANAPPDAGATSGVAISPCGPIALGAVNRARHQHTVRLRFGRTTGRTSIEWGDLD